VQLRPVGQGSAESGSGLAEEACRPKRDRVVIAGGGGCAEATGVADVAAPAVDLMVEVPEPRDDDAQAPAVINSAVTRNAVLTSDSSVTVLPLWQTIEHRSRYCRSQYTSITCPKGRRR
jgi:hypothetical protein